MVLAQVVRVPNEFEDEKILVALVRVHLREESGDAVPAVEQGLVDAGFARHRRSRAARADLEQVARPVADDDLEVGVPARGIDDHEVAVDDRPRVEEPAAEEIPGDVCLSQDART
jgi:hypothetical protein